MDSIMSKREKRKAIHAEMLSKEFLSQFKTEDDVSQSLKDLHSLVLEQVLQGEMNVHLGYDKHSADGYSSGDSRNDSFSKKVQSEYGEDAIEVTRARHGEFDPVVVPKYQSRGLPPIERLVISLYTKGMSVLDIEDELRDIKINLSTSAISIIANKVMKAASEWKNRPLERFYMVV